MPICQNVFFNISSNMIELYRLISGFYIIFIDSPSNYVCVILQIQIQQIQSDKYKLLTGSGNKSPDTYELGLATFSNTIYLYVQSLILSTWISNSYILDIILCELYYEYLNNNIWVGSTVFCASLYNYSFPGVILVSLYSRIYNIDQAECRIQPCDRGTVNIQYIAQKI